MRSRDRKRYCDREDLQPDREHDHSGKCHVVLQGIPVKELECADIVQLATNAFEDASIRERILYLEDAMKQSPHQVEIEPTHYFAKGLYAREITVPKGTLLTGKIHKAEHFNIVSKGDISVLTEDGPKRVQAPFFMVSRPGTKRVGYAHEDTVWTTIHACTETEIEKIEAELIADDYDAFDLIACGKEPNVCLS